MDTSKPCFIKLRAIDLPMTPDAQRELMLSAGFSEVNVVFSDLKEEGSFAVIVARR